MTHTQPLHDLEDRGKDWRGIARALVGRLLSKSADIFLPPVCLTCRTPVQSHGALCATCWADVTFLTPPLCPRLGIPLPPGATEDMVSVPALAAPPLFDRARAVAVYGGTMRQLIHDFKYRDSHAGRRLFREWLAQAGAEFLAEAELLVPVPLYPLRLLSRRFNQAAVLAQDLSRVSGVPWSPAVLYRRKRTRAQVGLSHRQRQRNVAGAFAVAPKAAARLKGCHVLLVDDVITTGATANACAQALKRAGARQVDVLALARVIDPQTLAP